MDPIISYGSVATGFTGLTATDDPRIVVTYPSGLVRVEQNYYCQATDAAAARASLAIGQPMPDGNFEPCVDGLFIYPAPQESQDGNIITFRVTAYGRNNTDATELVLLPDRLRQIRPYFCDFSVWKAAGSMCLPSGSTLGIRELGLDFNDDFLFPFDVLLINAPTKTMLGVTETTTIFRPPYAKDMGPAPDGKGNMYLWTQYSPVMGNRYYQVQMTEDGTTPSTTFEIVLRDPEIRYTATRFFGKFMEIDFESTRQIYEEPAA